MILYLLLLVGSLACTRAASVLSLVDTTSEPSLSDLNFSHLQAGSNDSAGSSNVYSSYCTSAQNWSLPELEPDDCSGVLDYFYLETADFDSRRQKEFRAPGAKKITKAKTEWTPRKYTFGKFQQPIYHSKPFFFSPYLLATAKPKPWFGFIKSRSLRKAIVCC